MLFNSIEFIYYFLPATLVAFYLAPLSYRFLVLFVASTVFYSWFNPAYTPLLLISIGVNFWLHHLILRASAAEDAQRTKRAAVSGIAFNLTTLGFFKYRGFVAENLGFVGPAGIDTDIVLPLAISFFTFQQIAFLVDTWRGQVRQVHPLRYAAYISFFPQLIAGPIVRHDELLPQLLRPGSGEVTRNLAIGSGLFIVGLFKKVVLADGAAAYATPAFIAVIDGRTVSPHDAWIGLLAYHFQIYFDFSGYSTMAIGLAKMFGLDLPLNFRSPYKAPSIIEFWRRWHMTLSRFLRDYLYIPLGGNRQGNFGRYSSLMITMLLGGFWHGAAWGFLLWGGMHGLYLIANHFWKSAVGAGRVPRSLAVGLTFVAVLVAWVPFRTEDLSAALLYYSSLVGLVGECSVSGCISFLDPVEAVPFLIALALIVWILPTAEQVFGLDRIDGAHVPRVAWRPGMAWAIILGAAFLTSITLTVFVGEASEFLYFQF